jgi:hypothetical protein
MYWGAGQALDSWKPWITSTLIFIYIFAKNYSISMNWKDEDTHKILLTSTSNLPSSSQENRERRKTKMAYHTKCCWSRLILIFQVTIYTAADRHPPQGYFKPLEDLPAELVFVIQIPLSRTRNTSHMRRTLLLDSAYSHKSFWEQQIVDRLRSKISCLQMVALSWYCVSETRPTQANLR